MTRVAQHVPCSFHLSLKSLQCKIPWMDRCPESSSQRRLFRESRTFEQQQYTFRRLVPQKGNFIFVSIQILHGFPKQTRFLAHVGVAANNWKWLLISACLSVVIMLIMSHFECSTHTLSTYGLKRCNCELLTSGWGCDKVSCQSRLCFTYLCTYLKLTGPFIYVTTVTRYLYIFLTEINRA